MKRTWLLLVLLAAVVPAAAADMYSWTDAAGVKHFSDSPPPNSVKAQKLKVTGGVMSPAAEAQKDEAGGPALAAAAGYAPADIKRNCETARRNLALVEAEKPAPDAALIDPGSVKARQARIDQAHQQITLFCPK